MEMNSPFRVPATPLLKKIACGTGVGVYRMDRSPKIGSCRSPWALKKINKMVTRGQAKERLKKEAEILKTLNHPNIVGYRAFSSESNNMVLAMEECGESLGDIIETRRENKCTSLLYTEIIKVIEATSKALEYIHKKRLIHGDIKSFNILVKGNFETIKLCDFGVSLELNEKGQADCYIGTECWSAPEVLNNGPITTKADIFSFGLTIWEMLTLQIPHCDDSTNDSYSCDSLDDTFPDSADNYGTRPPIPYLESQEYSPIIDMFVRCTEVDMEKRPTAQDIINFFNFNKCS